MLNYFFSIGKPLYRETVPGVLQINFEITKGRSEYNIRDTSKIISLDILRIVKRLLLRHKN